MLIGHNRKEYNYMQNSVKSISEVYSSDVEEFFYTEGDIPVSEGQLVGYDVELEDKVELVLEEGIYWNLSDE